GANLRHVSVNFDQEPALFAEIAKRDGLDMAQQFNVTGAQANNIASDYGLDHGFGSMLIAPDGRIAKVNPSLSELSSL
ncbi:MAG: SCO family protein, partial [Muribaculaceae bacterium]|nr:SCO family protein [Muribaculaceae bacterium]